MLQHHAFLFYSLFSHSPSHVRRRKVPLGMAFAKSNDMFRQAEPPQQKGVNAGTVRRSTSSSIVNPRAVVNSSNAVRIDLTQPPAQGEPPFALFHSIAAL